MVSERVRFQYNDILILIRLSASTGFFNRFRIYLHEILTLPDSVFEIQINAGNGVVKRLAKKRGGFANPI